jgi:hypothetical protein
MKKLLLTALAALSIGTAAMAQKIDNSSEIRNKAEGVQTNPFKNRAFNKGGEPVSAWFSIVEMIEQSNAGPALQGYVDFIVHDSLNKFVEDDGTIRYGGATSIGHIFDPKDDLIQLTANPNNQLSRFNSYKLDSIAFRYLYVRNVDRVPDGMGGDRPVVDTVFLSYWRGSQITRAAFTDGTRYARPTNGWDFGKRMPAGYFDIDTILISSRTGGIFDTTRANNNNGFENSWSSKYATFAAPANMTINANGSSQDILVGFAWTFKSGIPAVVGVDTAVFIYQQDPATAPAGLRRTNYFGYGLFLNEGAAGWENTTYHNTAQMALKASSYASVNGWNGYIAGQAFTSERFAEAFFHISVDTSNGKPGVGLTENAAVSILSVYPNPAKSNATVSLEIAKAGNVEISLVNLLGQTVKTFEYGKVTNGKYELKMDLNNVNAGVYMVNVKVAGSETTQKLIITE